MAVSCQRLIENQFSTSLCSDVLLCYCDTVTPPLPLSRQTIGSSLKTVTELNPRIIFQKTRRSLAWSDLRNYSPDFLLPHSRAGSWSSPDRAVSLTDHHRQLQLSTQREDLSQHCSVFSSSPLYIAVRSVLSMKYS